MLYCKSNNQGPDEHLTPGALCMHVVFLLGDFRDRDQMLYGALQDRGCKRVWQGWVWRTGKASIWYDGWWSANLCSDFSAGMYHLSFFFFLFQATSMYLENKYLFEGFMVSVKSGFLKLGHKNRTKILPSGKLTYIFKMYHVVLLIQTELYHWKHFPFGF